MKCTYWFDRRRAPVSRLLAMLGMVALIRLAGRMITVGATDGPSEKPSDNPEFSDSRLTV